MDIDLSAFHFLRPLWLLLVLPAIFLPTLWARRHDLKRQLDGMIAPHLLAHLAIRPVDSQRVRPAYLLGAVLAFGGMAAAGPTWKQDVPDFIDNRAPLILAVDLSPSMNADDVAPSRLVAAQRTLHDLIQRRAGSRTALIAYAGTAHLVLPATDDPALLNSFLEALSTDLMTLPGKDVLGVIDSAEKLLAAEHVPGTLVVVTDGADVQQLTELGKRLADTRLQLLVLAVGNRDIGLLRDALGRVRTDANNRPMQGNFDKQALEQLAKATHAPLGSLTPGDEVLDWIELHAQRHFEAAQADAQQVHWQDAGYWLCWPLAVLLLLCLRRGWQVSWLSAVLVAVLLSGTPRPAQAQGLTDLFFTPDQQGRWYFSHQQFGQAAAHFTTPYWKGVAAYNAANFDLAVANLSRVDSAKANFYLGNTYVRLFRFSDAVAAYEQALRQQPEFPQATANLALAQALLKDYEDQQQAGTPDEKADKVVEDQTPSKGGKAVQQQQAQAASDQVWLSNLTTSPAQFLKRKFRLQDAARQQSSGAAP